MKSSPWFRILLGAMLLGLGCAPKKVTPPAAAAPPPPAPKNSLVVLLQDPEGKTGKVLIRNTGGSVILEQRNSGSTIAREDRAPDQPQVLDEAEIQRRFGNVLHALPPAEVHYVLNFRLGSEELTRESVALLAEVKRVIQERHSTFVSITGHTDTTDTSENNYRLGMRRAERVAQVAKEAGVPANALFLSSHGEGDLLVKTADNVEEPKNRRVEIVIR